MDTDQGPNEQWMSTFFYDVTKNAVEILAIVPKSEAAEWLEKAGSKS